MYMYNQELIQGGHPGIQPPPPPNMATYYTVKCDKITFYLCVWSQKPPETVSEVVNFNNFLGEYAPRPPTLGTVLRARISPLYKKILY